MNHSERMLIIWHYGHHHNPRVNLPEMTHDEAMALAPGSDASQAMIASYQADFRAEFDQFALATHGRLGLVDGDPGPATDLLLDLPRCGMPDYRADTIAEANWPAACRRTLTFGRMFPSLPGLTAAETWGVWHAACNNAFYALADVAITPIDVGKLANITARLAKLQQGVLANSHLARNNCSAKLDQEYNSGLTWAMRLAIPTTTHELLHAIGCVHVFDSQATLYAMITDASMSRSGWLNASDLAECKRVGYTPRPNAVQPDYATLLKPRDSDEPPPPPPPPPGDTVCPSFDCPLPVMLTWLGMPEPERREATRAWDAFAERMNRGLNAAAEAREHRGPIATRPMTMSREAAEQLRELTKKESSTSITPLDLPERASQEQK